jgi:hypothetical protein
MTSMFESKPVFLSIALLLTFLFAQFGAVQHSVAHLSDKHTWQPDKKSEHSKTCDQCLGYAGFSGSLPFTDLQVPFFQGNDLVAVKTDVVFRSTNLFPFYSRAPPVL